MELEIISHFKNAKLVKKTDKFRVDFRIKTE